MTYGTLTLRRFNGIEIFPIISARMMLYEIESRYCLNLEIESDSNGSKTTTDTIDYPTTPNAEVSIYRDHFDPSSLVGQCFNVESAYDDRGDWVSRFYYYEHTGIDNNVVDFLTIGNDGRYHVQWTGQTIDPNFYDGSKPMTIVEIDAKFILQSHIAGQFAGDNK